MKERIQFHSVVSVFCGGGLSGYITGSLEVAVLMSIVFVVGTELLMLLDTIARMWYNNNVKKER